MCLILFALHSHPDYPLVLAANRDEYFRRPTRPAGFWPEAPQLLAGRDEEGGGTWLGVTRSGRFAALTNVREPGFPGPTTPISRGWLVREFLLGHDPAPDYLAGLQSNAYNGFNLLCGDLSALLQTPARASVHYHSNRQPAATALSSGIHGISNSALDTPWPKLVSGCTELGNLLARQHTLEPESLLAILNQRQPAADRALPDTGVGLAMERVLSSRFIEGQGFGYGTRASTVLMLHRSGRVLFAEWSWDAQGQPDGRAHYEFELSAQA